MRQKNCVFLRRDHNWFWFIKLTGNFLQHTGEINKQPREKRSLTKQYKSGGDSRLVSITKNCSWLLLKETQKVLAMVCIHNIYFQKKIPKIKLMVLSLEKYWSKVFNYDFLSRNFFKLIFFVYIFYNGFTTHCKF